MGFGRAEPEKIAWSHLPVGPPPAEKGIGVGCIANQVAGNSRKPGVLDHSWTGSTSGGVGRAAGQKDLDK